MECTSCHDPHQSPAPDPFYSHYPFASRSCSICHDVEESYKLLEEGIDLCVRCHNEIVTEAKVIHIPALADCTICHNPHQSENARLLEKPLEALCLDCHDRNNIEELHGEIMDCTSCHDPHQSEEDSLLNF